MDAARRQFALALAAVTYLRPSLFEPLSRSGVPRGGVVPGGELGRMIRQRKWSGTAPSFPGGPRLTTTSL